ncbi:MAG: phospho-N-acetylmuramoyl-pentapeptide-transferase [Defluviitaleaceae bacterium]|nr:phospho-N-acetylmuramoyl-pentapeptide-transferase [Defluviitaleaceae bacterium]
MIETAVIAALIAFAANIILCPIFIPWLKRVKFGQNIREDGPKTHLEKSGTPTMGGIVIIIAFAVGSLFFLGDNETGRLIVFVTLGFGAIGFLDDYIKVVKKRSLGLRALPKILLQLIVSAIFLFLLIRIDEDFARIYIPFMNGEYFHLGFMFVPASIFIILGTVNGVNFTDGLDGLAAGVTALVTTFFLLVAYGFGSEITTIAGAAAGSLLGFLLFNTYPARVFMGDTGSLALGGFIAAVAIVLRMPLFLAIVGFIYVIEVLSVIIQVLYFKKTGGKRFFKMAPIHHHFEQLGWKETKVVSVFYIITVILCLIGFLATGGII